ncbi:uncharacterized protein LOC129791909 [Lutzomyia longipalpis]|uniref:HTH psq-type domain-containing protein n=2 Tax=Lutzomyia longipalpis TaxID=7200 RepID=A0A1B0CLD5_LUTLO|nr:uncharacterized protein LOC129791909 [Lutzomyia longipalpis]
MEKDSEEKKAAWTEADMTAALDAIREEQMNLVKASVQFGIPASTLWQRATRLGIPVPKNGVKTKTSNKDGLAEAVVLLKNGEISVNKASKVFGIPPSTLYKIAKREKIQLSPPFNTSATSWTQDTLATAMDAIRNGHMSVHMASTKFKIPSGTLYGRCKREGLELSRTSPAQWSPKDLKEALDAIRSGQMSINQASEHFKISYSALYKRVKPNLARHEGHTGGYEGERADTSSALTETSESSTEVTENAAAGGGCDDVRKGNRIIEQNGCFITVLDPCHVEEKPMPVVPMEHHHHHQHMDVPHQAADNRHDGGYRVNGSPIGMGYLDFAPEPPAPSAIPVTGYLDYSAPEPKYSTSAAYPYPSNGYGNLRPLDPMEGVPQIHNHHQLPQYVQQQHPGMQPMGTPMHHQMPQMRAYTEPVDYLKMSHDTLPPHQVPAEHSDVNTFNHL